MLEGIGSLEVKTVTVTWSLRRENSRLQQCAHTAGWVIFDVSCFFLKPVTL